MNVLDIVLISVLVLATARGLAKGMIREVVSVGSIWLGIFLATRYHYAVEPYLAIHITNPMSVQAASYLVVFLATVAACWIAAKVLRDTMKVTLTSWIDHAAGAALGLAEGALVCLVALFMLSTFLPDAKFYRQSTLAPLAEPHLTLVTDVLPDAVRRSMQEGGFSSPGPELPKLPDLSTLTGTKTKPAPAAPAEPAERPAP
ncbi:MAG: CvpA family protein [Desulfovibrionaceae bacterium]